MASDSSLRGLREAVLRRVDWPNAPSSGTAKVDAFINLSIDQIALEAPFLFNEDFMRFATEPDVGPASATDTFVIDTHDDSVANGVNPQVLIKSRNTSQSQTTILTDRSWDGRFIDLIGNDGVVHRNQIRSCWTQTNYNGSGLDYYAISLVRPINYLTTGSYARDAMSWRIYTPTYYLPDNLIELKSMRVVGATQPPKIEILSQDEAEANSLIDVSGVQAGGLPMWAFRRGHFQLQGVNTAPDVAADVTRWGGPEPPGEFQYCYTLAWGKLDEDFESPGSPHDAYRHLDWQETDGSIGVNILYWGTNRSRTPRFESAPSPVSATYTVAPPSQGGTLPFAVQLTFPNIEYQLGYFQQGTYNAGVAYKRSHSVHSGVHLRIYRRRLTADFTRYTTFGTVQGTNVTGLSKLDIDDAYYLLAEFRIDSANEAGFVDFGFHIPDRSVRLRDIHGYQGFGLYPVADTRYEIEVRGLFRPKRLISDYDVPNIHAEACKLVVDYASSMASEMLKDPVSAASFMEQYKISLQSLVKRFSDMRPATQPVRKKPARARRYARFTPWWRSS